MSRRSSPRLHHLRKFACVCPRLQLRNFSEGRLFVFFVVAAAHRVEFAQFDRQNQPTSFSEVWFDFRGVLRARRGLVSNLVTVDTAQTAD